MAPPPCTPSALEAYLARLLRNIILLLASSRGGPEADRVLTKEDLRLARRFPVERSALLWVRNEVDNAAEVKCTV
jgi:hypothetical protein